MLLRRMIRNLLENGQLHGRPPIEVTVTKQGDRAVLNVLDHGPVIAAEARERLFSPFYRIPGSCAAKGSGLGLALVRQIACRHGGDVVYDPERGSSFTVSLPANLRLAASAAKAQPSM
jgi:signal transduction histidine kinase